ncbi:MAG: hypothetical protein JST10_15510 [Bacteroidetes bacterium]|nr:hypothetical protein [Bacteroidota bacterium]
MVKINELKQGDIVRVNDDGVMREGTISKVSHDDNQAFVDNGIQEFWYDPEEMFPLPLDEDQLLKLGFEKQEMENSVKYMKGAFRLVTPKKGDFSNIEMWYREDKRHFNVPLSVHELQNLHLNMTKMHLEPA